MKQKILETIQRMTNEKIKARKAPFHVMYMDLRRKFNDESKLIEGIRELIKEKRVKAGHTLNDRYLKPIQPMKKSETNLNHEIWYSCDCCNFQYDLRESCSCPICRTHKSESYGI